MPCGTKFVCAQWAHPDKCHLVSDTFALLGRVGTRSSAFALAYNAEIWCRRTACMTWQIFLWIGGTRHHSARSWWVGPDAQWRTTLQSHNKKAHVKQRQDDHWFLISHCWRKQIFAVPVEVEYAHQPRQDAWGRRLAPWFSKMIIRGHWEGIVSNESETEWISW